MRRPLGERPLRQGAPAALGPHQPAAVEGEDDVGALDQRRPVRTAERKLEPKPTGSATAAEIGPNPTSRAS